MLSSSSSATRLSSPSLRTSITSDSVVCRSSDSSKCRQSPPLLLPSFAFSHPSSAGIGSGSTDLCRNQPVRRDSSEEWINTSSGAVVVPCRKMDCVLSPKTRESSHVYTPPPPPPLSSSSLSDKRSGVSRHHHHHSKVPSDSGGRDSVRSGGEQALSSRGSAPRHSSSSGGIRSTDIKSECSTPNSVRGTPLPARHRYVVFFPS